MMVAPSPDLTVVGRRIFHKGRVGMRCCLCDSAYMGVEVCESERTRSTGGAVPRMTPTRAANATRPEDGTNPDDS